MKQSFPFLRLPYYDTEKGTDSSIACSSACSIAYYILFFPLSNLPALQTGPKLATRNWRSPPIQIPPGKVE